MSVQKKSLISNRATVKKAIIASKTNQPVGETKALKASAPKIVKLAKVEHFAYKAMRRAK